MKILAPVDKPKEIPLLSKAGATEFYCGYIPQSWVEKYNKNFSIDGKWNNLQVSINRRERLNANVQSIQDLKIMVNEAKLHKCELFLTLNTMYYPQEVYEELISYINDVNDAGISGLIVSDPGLITFIKTYFSNIKLILSCCTPVYNKWSNRFFVNLGIERITFPRHMTIKEVVDISKSLPTVEYECFILDGKCIYDDGHCNAMDCAGRICVDQWENNYYSSNNELTYQDYQDLYRNEMIFTKWSKPYSSFLQTRKGWGAFTCGVCAIPTLINESNVTTLKLAGRGWGISEKFKIVRFVNQIITLSKSGVSSEDIKKYAKDIFPDSELCDKKQRCFFASYK
jgi:U32 family peptidase